jgi:hypothetical protein
VDSIANYIARPRIAFPAVERVFGDGEDVYMSIQNHSWSGTQVAMEFTDDIGLSGLWFE